MSRRLPPSQRPERQPDPERRRKGSLSSELLITTPERATVFLGTGTASPGRDAIVRALQRADVNVEDVRRNCDGSRLLFFAPPRRIPDAEIPHLARKAPDTLVCLSLTDCDETWDFLRDKLGSDPQFGFQEMKREFDRGNTIVLLEEDDGTSWMGLMRDGQASRN